MARKIGIDIKSPPPLKIKVGKPAKSFKGKPLKDAKVQLPRTRPAGGGTKGY